MSELIRACIRGNLKTVKRLTTNRTGLITYGKPFLTSVRKGHSEIVEYFVENTPISQFVLKEGLELAAERDYVDIVIYLMNHVIPDQYALIHRTFRHCSVEVADYLINNPSIQLDILSVTFVSHFVTRELRCKKLIEIYLASKRVDPSEHDNYLLQRAIRAGNFELVKMLLRDRRVISKDLNSSFRMAVKTKNLDVVKYMSKFPNVDVDIVENPSPIIKKFLETHKRSRYFKPTLLPFGRSTRKKRIVKSAPSGKRIPKPSKVSRKVKSAPTKRKSKTNVSRIPRELNVFLSQFIYTDNKGGHKRKRSN